MFAPVIKENGQSEVDKINTLSESLSPPKRKSKGDNKVNVRALVRFTGELAALKCNASTRSGDFSTRLNDS